MISGYPQSGLTPNVQVCSLLLQSLLSSCKYIKYDIIIPIYMHIHTISNGIDSTRCN